MRGHVRGVPELWFGVPALSLPLLFSFPSQHPTLCSLSSFLSSPPQVRRRRTSCGERTCAGNSEFARVAAAQRPEGQEGYVHLTAGWVYDSVGIVYCRALALVAAMRMAVACARLKLILFTRSQTLRVWFIAPASHLYDGPTYSLQRRQGTAAQTGARRR